MHLLFTYAPSVVSLLVKSALRSRHSHVDIVLSDTLLLGAIATENRVLRHSFAERVDHSTNAVLMEIPLLPAKQAELIDWALGQEGKCYDWKAALTVFSTNNRNWKDERKWMCSELVAAGFQRIGLPLFDDAVTSRVVPEDLYRLPYKKTLFKGKL